MNEQISIEQLFRTVLHWAPPTALVIGVIHEITFWTYMDFDILMYLGIADFVRISIGPLVITTPIVLLVVYLVTVRKTIEDAQSDPFKRRMLTRGKRIEGFLAFVALGIMAIGSLYLYLNSHVDSIVAVTSLVAAIVSMGMLSARAFLRSLSIGAKVFVCVGLVYVPLLAWYAGREVALAIKQGTHYFEARMPMEQALRLGLPTDQPLRHVKHVNDYDFFLIDKKIVAVRSSELHQITFNLRREKQHRPTSGS